MIKTSVGNLDCFSQAPPVGIVDSGCFLIHHAISSKSQDFRFQALRELKIAAKMEFIMSHRLSLPVAKASRSKESVSVMPASPAVVRQISHRH
ncbi:MAG: hypothetical protein ACK5JM_09440 [Rhodoblastus sp.]